MFYGFVIAGVDQSVRPQPEYELDRVSGLGSIALTLVWYVGMMNAINFIDGLDGLLAGVPAIFGHVHLRDFGAATPIPSWRSVVHRSGRQPRSAFFRTISIRRGSSGRRGLALHRLRVRDGLDHR